MNRGISDTELHAIAASDQLDACLRLTETDANGCVNSGDIKVIQHRLCSVLTKAISMTPPFAVNTQTLMDIRLLLLCEPEVALSVANKIRVRIAAHEVGMEGLVNFTSAVYFTRSNGARRLTDENEAMLPESELQQMGEERAQRLGLTDGYILVSQWFKGTDA